MFSQRTALTALQTRKRLLVVEAELHRQQVQRELTIIKSGFHAWSEQLHSASAFFTSAGRAVSAVADFKQKLGGKRSGQPGVITKVLDGARMVSTIWRAFRSNSED